jgi:hypothetical protein
MYSAALILHSWLRWLVLVAALLVIARALAGSRGNKSWAASGTAGSLRLFVIAMDLQLLIGLALYGFLSPFTQAAFQDMAAAMRNAAVRFFAVEHLVGMVIAVIFAHVGSVQIRKATSEGAKYQRAIVFTAIAIVIVLASIPWPGMASGRPLFRF